MTSFGTYLRTPPLNHTPLERRHELPQSDRAIHWSPVSRHSIAFIFLVLSLYNLLKDVDRKQARLMVLLVAVSVAIVVVNLIIETAPLAGYTSSAVRRPSSTWFSRPGESRPTRSVSTVRSMV